VPTRIANGEESGGSEEGCTTTFTGEAGGSWQTAGNWSTASAPSSGDRACIPAGKSATVSSGTNQVGSIAGEGAVAVSGGTLELTDGSTVSEIDDITLQQGTLGGAGTLYVYGTLTGIGSGNPVVGLSQLVLASGATGTIDATACGSGGGDFHLTGVELVNEGTLTLGTSGGGPNGDLYMSNGAKLLNRGTFNADSWSNNVGPCNNPPASFFNGGGSPNITNTGTFNVDVGGGNATEARVPFYNEGTVHVASGSFTPTAGGSSTGGTWTTASGTSVSFSTGSYSLSHADASGASLLLNGGTLGVSSGTSKIGSLSLVGGTLSVGGELDVTGSLSGSGANHPTISGSGRVVVKPGASGSIDSASCSSGGGDFYLTGVDLVNEGTLTLGVSGGGPNGDLWMSSGAQLENKGTFNDDSWSNNAGPCNQPPNSFVNAGGSPSITNTGTFNVEVGAGNTSQSAVPFNNEGDVHVLSGLFTPLGGVSSSSGKWTTASGALVNLTSGAYTLAGADASAASFAVSSGGALDAAASTTSKLGTLTFTGGVVSVTGELQITGTFTGVGANHPTISGTGHFAIAPGAAGTVDPSGCSGSGGDFHIDGATLLNEGTFTLGVHGGGANGDLWMTNGAQVQNEGHFNDDGWSNNVGPCNQPPDSFVNGGGSTPSITNNGTFEVEVGAGNVSQVAVPFENRGTVHATSGQLKLGAGGVSGEVATGGWQAAVANSIWMSSGTYTIEEGVEFHVDTEGSTIIWVPAHPRGTIETPSPAAGTVTISGQGEGSIAGPLAAAEVEIAAAGTSEWHALCGPLIPGGFGEFSCSWNTASGSYPDGDYQLRALLSTSSTPPATGYTQTVYVLVDNTVPSGSLSVPSHAVGGWPTITGSASDSGSGVASWQLQIAAQGSSEWSNACPAQAAPISSNTYGCALNAAAHTDGAYQLRALITDGAGGTHTTAAAALQIDNATPSGTLAAPAGFIGKTVEPSGTASATGTTVASWALQSAPAATNEWSGGCSATTPSSGSEYRCSLNTTTLADGEYELRAVVTDSEGDTYTSASRTTTVDNTPPTGALYPLPAKVTGNLEVDGSAHDTGSGVASWKLQIASAGSESYEEACSSESLLVSGVAYGCTLETGSLSSGTFHLRAVIADQVGNSYTTPVTTIVVENAAPSSSSAPAIAGEAVDGRTLSSSTGEWNGDGPISYGYQWRRCNSSGESCANIEGATGATYVLTTSDVGHALRVIVTATNAAGEASATSAASETVAASALANVTAPSIAGTARVDGAVTADPGRWRGAPPISYAYQWQRCNSSGESCTSIEGATQQSYAPVAADLSQTLRVQVTASDGEGSASAASAASPLVVEGAGSGIRYLYDEAGRLDLVDDPTQGAAVYRWDADGNLLSIKRYSASSVSVLQITPAHAPPGTQVDVTGTGFSTEASNDEVSFDGTPATVSRATATDLYVTVPEGATTGAITVKVGEHTGESPGAFKPFARTIRRPAKASTQISLARPTASVPSAQPEASAQRQAASGPASTYRSPYAPAWHPGIGNRRDGNWVTGRKASPWTRLSKLSARRGATALSGQTLVIDGTPLAGVTISLPGAGKQTRTDSSGRFLLSGLPAGHQVLAIEGQTARASGKRFGRFTVGVDLLKDKANSLGYTIWMTPLDPAGDSRIPAQVKHETVLTNPDMPGLEVRLPAGTTVRSASGAVVHHLNLTAIPIDRPPFPLPFVTGIPTYFTVQPGEAYLNKGAQIIYPNWGHLPPGQRADFWNYDPTDRGWYVYGKGTVSKDGKQVIPDPDVRVWEFTGAMMSTEGGNPGGPPSGGGPGGGDPVDLGTGLFVYRHTDLQAPDSVMPFALTRTYRPNDTNSHGFGIGTESPLDLRLWSNENYRAADLVLPDGGAVKFKRTSPGSGFTEAVYSAIQAPGPWQGAVLQWYTPESGWVVRRRDGMKYYFPDYDPVRMIEDRKGNRIHIVREGGGNGPAIEVRGPHDRSIYLHHDSYNRITEATNSAGQKVHYAYDSLGRLVKFTDATGAVTRYSYDAANEMTSVTDGRGNVVISNSYDSGGHMRSQSLATKGTYRFLPLPTCSGCEAKGVTASQVIDPDGRKRDYYFTNGLVTSEVFDPGSSEQWVNYTRDGEGNVTRITGSAGEVSYTYDSEGNVTSETREADGSAPLRTRYTYNSFAEPNSVTDPLGLTTEYSYDGNGTLTAVTDPMGRQTTRGYDAQGEMTSSTDAQGNTTKYAYSEGDLTAETDPLGYVTEYAYSPAGVPISVRDPEGRTTAYKYDADNKLESVTNAAGETTTYKRDADGHVVEVTDPRGHSQTGSYNAFDQLAEWTDALGRTTHYAYDPAGALASVTDARGQKTTYSHNGLGWLSSISYGAVGEGAPTSTIGYGYDSAGNLATVTDSRAGTWTFGYDPFHRLTEEAGPGGTVTYSHNADGERTRMSVGGEEAASYSYDDDGKLTGVTTPAGNVSLTYNRDGRKSQTVLPDGDVERYSYDAAGQLTGIGYYKSSGEAIGDLQYVRDALGRVATIKGSEARVTLPSEVSEASYDAANELTSWNGLTSEHNADGELASEGSSTFAWNDRNQLTGVAAGSNNWSYAYDPFGRRISKTVNGAETKYSYDGPNVLTETLAGATATLLNGLGIDQRFARTTSAGTSSYLTDQLGSTIGLAGSSGTPATEYSYQPFGAASAIGTSSSNDFEYTGRETEENGLQYNRARYYNPTVGRFISQDPLGSAGSGINLYRYVNDAPTNATDPSGLVYNPLETEPRGQCEAEKRLYEGTPEEMHGTCGPVEVPRVVETALCKVGAGLVPLPGNEVTKVLGGEALDAACEEAFPPEKEGGGSGPGGGGPGGGGPGGGGSGGGGSGGGGSGSGGGSFSG
jgi:RHS repeat-associated protein